MTGASMGAPLYLIQVLIDFKSADATALTAEEAIRHLLGFDDRLLTLRRRLLYEIVLAPRTEPGTDVPIDPTGLFQEYMRRTILLWNSNKHRAWIRVSLPGERPRAFEFGASAAPGEFGRPPLSREEDDHLLIWNREGETAPPDLSLPGWTVVRYGKGEVYTMQWREGAQTSERVSWTEGVAVTRNRGVGLLVNPHSQDYLRCSQGLPIPAFPETGGSMDGFHHECGLIGIHGRGDVTDLIYYGLYALQHRGQEGAGMVLHNGQKTRVLKGLGLVSETFTEEARRQIDGYMGIGHNRYATTGKSTKMRNVQPILVDYKGGKLAIAHNGNLTNVGPLRARMEQEGSIFQTTTDSEVVLHLIARSNKATLAERAAEALGQVEGAMTCLLMDTETLIGYRDPLGFRPLTLGELDGMHVLASETCAFDLIGARVTRDVEPGEMIILSRDGCESRRVAPSLRQAKCLFELIYFSRPDSIVFGESVNRVRRQHGRLLARRHPAAADLVISIPDSSNSAALGYAEESGLPFELGLIRNHYVGRTFIQAGAQPRIDSVRVKFNAVRGILEGKRVVAVDDSIVRGTTSRELVQLLYRAGAKEVHFRVASPPITHPCYYGIDTPTRAELIANHHDVEGIRRFIGAASLGFLALSDLEESVGRAEQFCYACWTGRYPTAVPENGSSVPFDRA